MILSAIGFVVVVVLVVGFLRSRKSKADASVPAADVTTPASVSDTTEAK